MTEDAKNQQLEGNRIRPDGTRLTTHQGTPVDHTDDSLKAGERGPTLLEDFHAREKITHFDHERIPERVVHARGAGAYGHFRPYDDRLARYTVAEFLADPGLVTPVFTRFSTVAGSRGSADTVRDVRGFATKFYTRQGNYDLVGNNMPVFFIQDGIKFPDFVHAVKPEPHNEIPQAQSAHDTLWDFVAQQPETMHMMLWLMSDRALPRSYRMMQGFGVHTFRLVNASGESTFVKFHWRPKLGTHGLVWDECQKVAGKDPDYNRRDLWEAIETGNFPEWELGVQLIPDDFDEIDILDATKLIPEETIPVTPVGTLVLDRNPDNFFAETEQVAFHTANVVPGIDFTDDPLLAMRNFSYLDTQLLRLGGPNFAHIPVNRPVAEAVTDQRDGFHQEDIYVGRTSYTKNTLSGGCPFADVSGGFTHYPEPLSGAKTRRRAESFRDHYSQATLFWNSMSPPEKEHIVAAFRFELGHVDTPEVRQAVVERLDQVDHDLAVAVAIGAGVSPPSDTATSNHGRSSPALSMAPDGPLNANAASPATRKIAILASGGVDGVGVSRLVAKLREAGAEPELLSPLAGPVSSSDGSGLQADHAVAAMSSVLYDAVVVASGKESADAIASDGYALHFVTEAYKHHKPVAAFGAGVEVLALAGADGGPGVVTTDAAGVDLPDDFAAELLGLIARHRVWDRDTAGVPA
jgi:catalase